MENFERTYKTEPNRINVDEKYYFRIRKDLHRNQKRSKQIYIGIRKDLSRSKLESEKI